MPDDGGRERETLARVTMTLRQLQRHGINTIPVGDVLVMLGASPADGAGPPGPKRDPGADPITGCRPVTAGS